MQTLPLIVLLPLLLGTVVCLWFGRRARQAPAWAAAAVTAAALALLSSHAPAVLDGQTLLTQQPWVPAIGLDANFRLDGLALMFGWMITVVGLLVILYAAYYLGPNDPPGRFYALIMLFMAAMLGVVLSDNLLLLVVFWELTSVSSFLLVGYWGQRADARAGARMALAVTGGGGLALLAGVVLLGQIAGSYDLSAMLSQGAADPRGPALPGGAGADPAGLLHQERAVAVPLLAARGHGRADAGVGLPAFGDDGQGRRLPAGAAVPGARRLGAVRAAGGRRRPGDACSSPPTWRCSSTTSRGCWPIRPSATWG